MRILFIRHAEAEDASTFLGTDMDRPLTGRGRKAMKKMAARLADIYAPPATVLTSCAERARATAELVARAWGVSCRETPLLNPGASTEDVLRVLKGVKKKEGCVSLVGHEPDFSSAIARLTSRGTLRMKLKKGACAEVEWDGGSTGTLRALLDPAALVAR